MKIALFVPIKLNSQRLKNKMLLPLGEKKLCQHIFDVLLDVKKYFDTIDKTKTNTNSNINIYCFCSDPNIRTFLPDDVIFLKRCKSLDTNLTKGLDIYKSFAKYVNTDIYCLCHATSPFIKKESIIEGINKVMTNQYDSAFSVSKIQTFSWFENKPLNYDFNDVVRTQDIQPVYWETSAFYIYKREILMNCNRRIGFKSCMIETSRLESIDIDEQEDYDLALLISNNTN